MEFEKKKVSAMQSLRGFISKNKCNPMSKTPVVIAKDSSYPYQRSEDAYVLLLPLIIKDMYMYVQPYVDSKTELTEYCIKVARIDNLVTSGNSQISSFNGSCQDDVRLNKGVRYVQFLADYFDPEKNKYLYKTVKNSRMVAERKAKFDTDKQEYQEKAGYVELQHLRVQSEGNAYNYVQMMCVKAYKGERAPAKICAIIDGEWKFVSKYLNFIIRYYRLNDVGMSDGVQKKRIESMRRDVLDAMGKFFEKSKKEDKKEKNNSANQEDGSDMEDESGPSKKRKIAKNPIKLSKTKTVALDDEMNDECDYDSDKENKSPNPNVDGEVQKIEDEIAKSVKKMVQCNEKDQNADQDDEGKDSGSDSPAELMMYSQMV